MRALLTTRYPDWGAADLERIAHDRMSRLAAETLIILQACPAPNCRLLAFAAYWAQVARVGVAPSPGSAAIILSKLSN